MAGEREAAFEDLFRDPIVLMVMKSDRVAAEDARRLYAEVAERLRMRRRVNGGEPISARAEYSAAHRAA